MNYLVAIASAIKIGAEVLGYILEQKTIAEKNNQDILQYRRALIKRKTEYKARGKILDYLSQNFIILGIHYIIKIRS